MARATGTFPFSANFETKIAGTLDARQLVDDFADLLNFTGDNFIPNGFPVAVKGTTTPSERGVYQCIDNQNLGLAASWERIQGSLQNLQSVLDAGSFASIGTFSLSGEDSLDGWKSRLDLESLSSGSNFQFKVVDESSITESASLILDGSGTILGEGKGSIGFLDSRTNPKGILLVGYTELEINGLSQSAIMPRSYMDNNFLRLSNINQNIDGTKTFIGNQTIFEGLAKFSQEGIEEISAEFLGGILLKVDKTSYTKLVDDIIVNTSNNLLLKLPRPRLPKITANKGVVFYKGRLLIHDQDLPPNSLVVEFDVTAHFIFDDTFSTYPTTGHYFTIIAETIKINGTTTATFDLVDRVSSNPGESIYLDISGLNSNLKTISLSVEVEAVYDDNV